jgi:cysteine desulfurase
MKKEIYLDHGSTTPIDKKVLEKMMPYLTENYGNPSSIHASGQKALLAIDDSREKVASFLNCRAEEVYFTGSATEANNMAILGLIKKLQETRKKLHIIASTIEHDAVLAPCRYLEKNQVSVTFLPVNSEGIVEKDSLIKAIRDETCLVSIMYVNNEIGTIQPIQEIGEIIEKENKKRKESERIFFHSDAVQAVNYLDCDVNLLKVDMLSLSGHKIYGPKGIGALYLRKKVVLEPIIWGGGQERNLRSGTPNVAGIVGLAKAIELVKENSKNNLEIKKIRDSLITKVLKEIKDSQVNGCLENRVVNNVNFSFKGAEGESVVMALDQKKIYTSTGSACSSKSLEPSHVLLAINLSREKAHCSLRISLGRETKQEQVDYLFSCLVEIVGKLRKISGK